MKKLTVIILIMLSAVSVWAFNVDKSKGQTVYIPVYSEIYAGARSKPMDLVVTVSIHNTSSEESILLEKVDYHDTSGNLIKHYLDKPLLLGPLATAQYIVREKDDTGGSGANFIVKWSAKEKVPQPVTESVMIGAKSSLGISFVSPGVIIK
ncbi:DUF3124 domain-containing protein [Limisalsivibrio acetivorans]|uniref:DUF3124 domain-containing protein n=1 Tax=Limisalsivibrio acetivorans TaxID=1304888 RepID=UPI0003B32381|nr:DUF3124 domain-containing protein [Limisalsivibrio acetivorans]